MKNENILNALRSSACRSRREDGKAHGIADESMPALFVYEEVCKQRRSKKWILRCSERKQSKYPTTRRAGVGSINSSYVMTIHAGVIGCPELGFTDAIRGQSATDFTRKTETFLRAISEWIGKSPGPFRLKNIDFSFSQKVEARYEEKFYKIVIWLQRRNKCWKFPP